MALLRRIAATGVIAATIGGVAVMAAQPAAAHVTVSANGATAGGSDQLITFRVPTESATASTVELQVKFPTDTPIATILVAPHPGWADTVTSVKLAKPIVTDDGDIATAVSTITWKADGPGGGIAPGDFDQFVVIAGQLPDVSALTFPAIQTYSDGSVVKWIEVAAPGSPEPDHPAPVLQLAKAAGTAASVGVTASPSTDAASKASATVGIVLGGIGMLLGGAALALVVLRGRR